MGRDVPSPDLAVDVPEADALEQERSAVEEQPPERVQIGVDVPEADALEQARDAGLDDEEHG